MKGTLSISLAALLLAAVFFAMLEAWIEIQAHRAQEEISRLHSPERELPRSGGAEASSNH